MNTDIEALRKKYMENPPEGMTSQDIRSMSEDDLLDMDYFLLYKKGARCSIGDYSSILQQPLFLPS